MSDNSKIIGRQREIALLQEIMESPKAEFVAVYGRRRIGKTYLIDKFFGDTYDFYMTGIYEGTRKEQLTNFAHQLEVYSSVEQKVPKDWMEALFMLRKYLETLKHKERIVLFIDEMPWLDTHYSRFLKAFELFWNEWASKLDNIKLIVCGSATTWMTNTLLGNKGGLHNRVTRSIYLRPFNLAETEEFLVSRGFQMERFQIAELYMSMGGTPFYLNMLKRSLSVAQNVDELFFSQNAPLRSEYGFLFKSLFKESTLYRKVVEVLAKKLKGMTRPELIEELRVEDTGYVSTVLADLCNCDFIRKYSAFGKTDRDFMYQLTDLYSLFYLKFVKNYHGEDEHYWSHRQMDISSWEGYAFEQVCLHHIPQIKKRLGINGILSNVCTWSYRGGTDADGNKLPGAQVDLVLDRGDKTINLCEMKFVSHAYSISSDYAAWLTKRRELFRQHTGTRKTLHLTMITSYGLEHNAGWQTVQNEVVLDDLFKGE